MNRLIMRILWVFCRAWLLGGLGAIAVGLGFGIYNIVFLSRSVSAMGTVERLTPVVDQDDGTINYAPVFTFTAQDGHLYTVTEALASNPPGFTVGQVVRVLYLKTNPAGAKLGYFWELWFDTILCAGLGLFLTGAGYLLLRYEPKRQRLAALAARASAVTSR
jgi:hypothetical protein